MDLRGYLKVLQRRWISILVITLATLAVTAGITFALTPQYTASTRLFFGVQGAQSGSDLAQGSTFAEAQLTSYAQVATSPLVLAPVIQNLGLQLTPSQLASKVSAFAPTDTVIIQVTVTDTDAARSAAIANAVGQQLASVTSDLSPRRQDGSQSVKATILAPAQVPTDASSPNILRNLAAGLILGLLLGIAVAIARRLLDTKVRNEADLEQVTTVPVLGVVPFDSDAEAHPVVIRDDPLSVRAEAVRRLRTNLQFVEAAEQSRSVVVTSSIPGEGKSTAALNLAASLSDAGLNVVLVDADLRRPSIARYVGIEGSVGLTTVLIGEAALDDVLQPWGDSSLRVLPSGQVPPNPSELLGSGAMADLLDQLTERFDMVILDSPPLLPVTDGAILGRLAGTTLVVVGADRLHRSQLRGALESLSTAGVHVSGVVLNKVAAHNFGPYEYGYTYMQRSDQATVAPKPPRRAEGKLPRDQDQEIEPARG
ncbi:tyrosine-protein kinase domain-containing protein [Microlunatus antarcticus]|uniref:non-specific protein-tyrosine kinase n=1 Tax=Microlunatus antarcticus TaxID=53388 RepID=A0A7W5JXP1_9ACTN|nr:polysaccharide biosynthesis tyrosine autokinase [Microlunatus antarcticus]MBB3328185.1 capsular exopolysaccharide synthesis family protein [Microlunatus antarcticus]